MSFIYYTAIAIGTKFVVILSVALLSFYLCFLYLHDRLVLTNGSKQNGELWILKLFNLVQTGMLWNEDFSIALKFQELLLKTNKPDRQVICAHCRNADNWKGKHILPSLLLDFFSTHFYLPKLVCPDYTVLWPPLKSF